MSQINVIINADDLGLNHEVNLAICQALDKEVITSSTILANTEYWEDVENIVNKYPNASFGIHLNLTQGRSCTNNTYLKINGIIDEKGMFVKGAIYKIKKFSVELKGAIYEEWVTQIEEVLKHGIKISHIDGHHHVHAIQDLEEILISIKQKFGIISNRNRYTKPFSLFLFLEQLKKKNQKKSDSIFMEPLKNKLQRKNIIDRACSYIKLKEQDRQWKRSIFLADGTMTQFFDSYETFVHNLEIGMIVPHGSSVELMCHPGHTLYKKETGMLYRKEIENYGLIIHYINYRDL